MLLILMFWAGCSGAATGPVTLAHAITEAYLPALPANATDVHTGGEIGFQEDLILMRFTVPTFDAGAAWLARLGCSPEHVPPNTSSAFARPDPDNPWMVSGDVAGSTVCVRPRSGRAPTVDARLEPTADGRYAVQLVSVTDQ
jgi:hypothetical protein